MSTTTINRARRTRRGPLRWMHDTATGLGRRREARAVTAAVAALLNPAEVEAALIELREGRDMEAEGRKRAEHGKALLEGIAARAGIDQVPAGVYGRLRLRRGRDSERLDSTAARDLLVTHGLPVPVSPVRGSVTAARVG